MLEIPTWTGSSKGTKRGKSTAEKQTRFVGPIEVDETYIGGKKSNKHVKNRLRTGKGTAGKIPVAGVKNRDTKEVRAIVKYIAEFVARQHTRARDTIDQMKLVVQRFEGQRLRYCDLIT